MRKLTVLAMLAATLMVGPAFARSTHNLMPTPNATFSPGVGGAASGPSTTNNDDTCDISVAPAATLLLPYFEVDFKSSAATARTTLFTITNVSYIPQIAHVVVWTDWSFPALDFNIFLTGYDVQPINLYDIFARGIIAPNSGTSSNTTVPTNPTAGSTPQPNSTAGGNSTNPNINSYAGCVGLPGAIPPSLLTDLQLIFTTGKGSGVGIGCTSTVGGTHANAVGYITVDVNANCNTSLPNVFTYFTTNILWDNVLIGDYEDIQPNPALVNAAGGAPMVHIRAIPEGGPVGTLSAAGVIPTNLPFTFYDRYTVNAAGVDRRIDRRQPLPALFAARYISGGTGSFNTNYKIWREGITVGGCTTGATGAINNSSLAFTEFVKFDEHENASIAGGGVVISPAPPGSGLPETSLNAVSGSIFPPIPTAASDIAGWMYLNLDNGSRTPYSRDNAAGAANRPSQNWVVINMTASAAQGQFSVNFDSAWLGNGCSSAVPATTTQIGPSQGIILGQSGAPVCPPPIVCPVQAGSVTYTGTNVTPP